MYWEQRNNRNNWIEQIRYFCDHQNNLTKSELQDAFIHLAYLYVTDFSNLRLLEDKIVQEYGESIIEGIMVNTVEGRELSAIDYNNGNVFDILGITLKLCNYIEHLWF